MHEVHSKLEKTSSDPSTVLPSSIIELYNSNKKNLEFWNDYQVVSNLPQTQIIAPQTKNENTYNLFSQ